MHLYNFREVQIIWDQSGFIELCVTLKRHLPACQFITKVRDLEDTDRATWVITPVTTGQSSWTWADPRKALNVLLWSSETESIACHSAGLLRQPKWGHLGDLHKAIKQVEPALVAGDSTVQSIGNYEKVLSRKRKEKIPSHSSSVNVQSCSCRAIRCFSRHTCPATNSSCSIVAATIRTCPKLGSIGGLRCSSQHL